MKATLEDFNTGWLGLSLELTGREIDQLVEALTRIRASGGHFHCRSNWSGNPGIGDIEVSLCNSADSGSLTIEGAPAIEPDCEGA